MPLQTRKRCPHPRRIAGLILVLLSFFAAPVFADEADAAARIKVAYLYNFMKFIYWPEGSFADLRLCVLGDPPLARIAAENMTGRSVRGHNVVVQASEGGGLDGCHMIYSTRPVSAGRAMLTVGEGLGFVENGGMIGFVQVENRIRFYINLEAVRAAQLRADSQLLTSAYDVIK